MAGLSMFVEGRVRDQIWIPEDHKNYASCTGYAEYFPGFSSDYDSKRIDVPSEEESISRHDSIQFSRHKPATEKKEESQIISRFSGPGVEAKRALMKQPYRRDWNDSNNQRRNVTITTRYCEPTELELVSKIRGDQELSRQLVYSNNELLHDQKASISNLGKKVDELHSSITRGTPRKPSLQETIGILHSEMTATRAAVQQLGAIGNLHSEMTATRAAVQQLGAIGNLHSEMKATHAAVQQLGTVGNRHSEMTATRAAVQQLEAIGNLHAETVVSGQKSSKLN